ncbi:YrhK family protein [Hoeflea sp.]|uniref:YrhK family protein n=1 Tax=Hoeflea sp. TaxID=1940281 RepID=UPI003BAF4E52
MPIFKPSHRRQYVSDKVFYAWFELIYTFVDVSAALLFIIGSVMFFSENWQTAGTWCFLFGSICFALKPTMRIIREVRYFRENDLDDLAKRFENGS